MRDLTKYMPLLHKIAGAFPKKFRDDLLQEGYIALYRADELFDETKGTAFISYAYKFVFGAMNKYVRSFTTNISLDNTVEDADGGTITYADLLESDEDVYAGIENRDYYDKNLAKSTVVERFIKRRFYEDGFTEQEIIDLYKELHMISSIKTIRKILRK